MYLDILKITIHKNLNKLYVVKGKNMDEHVL